MESAPSEIVADFYDAGLDGDLWPQALLSLAELAKADCCALASHDFDLGLGHFEQSVGLTPELQASYRRNAAQANVWLQAEGFFRRAPSLLAGRDIMGEEAVKATAFYRTWLQPAGLLHHLFLVLDRQGGRLSYVVIARRDAKPDFEPATIEALQPLLPALARAVRAALGVRAVRAVERASLRAVDAMPIGIAVLDRNGGLVQANTAARAVFDAGEGIALVNGSLVVDIGSRRLKIRDQLARAHDRYGTAPGDPYPALSIPRPSGRRPLTVLLVPLDDGEPAEQPGAPAALMFIGDPERPVHFDQTRIARLYGLSRAESRVAALLASGYRLEQVAETLDIAYETVRKHLKQIFGKTGTFRQAELVRMLVTGPAGLSV